MKYFINKNKMEEDNITTFINDVTHLPFERVILLCETYPQLNEYCTDPRYSSYWKKIIKDTFSHVYDYEKKLELFGNRYDYNTYTGLINLLSIINLFQIVGYIIFYIIETFTSK